MEYINAWKIYPPHTIERMDEYAEIKSSMKANGWTGRPIVAVKFGNKLLALTGSHRICAARQTKTDIPVHIVDSSAYKNTLFRYSYEEVCDEQSKYSIDYLTTVFPSRILTHFNTRKNKDRIALSLLKIEEEECYL